MKKFSKNIKYDEDAYYMSCPEFIADYIANLLKGYKCAVELCSAIGITACALAKNIEKVYGIKDKYLEAIISLYGEKNE